MTDHPLTDDLINEINEKNNNYDEDLRAAADWQLEQVIKWLNETIFEQTTCVGIESLPEELEKAMRPQEDN